jgi:hypothetical protein
MPKPLTIPLYKKNFHKRQVPSSSQEATQEAENYVTQDMVGVIKIPYPKHRIRSSSEFEDYCLRVVQEQIETFTGLSVIKGADALIFRCSKIITVEKQSTSRSSVQFSYIIPTIESTNEAIQLNNIEIESIESSYTQHLSRRGVTDTNDATQNVVESRLKINWENFAFANDRDPQSGHMMMVKSNIVRDCVIVGSKSYPIFRVFPLASLDSVSKRHLKYKITHIYYVPLSTSMISSVSISLVDTKGNLLLEPVGDSHFMSELVLCFRPCLE